MVSFSRISWGASVSKAEHTAFAANSCDEQSMSMPSNSRSITRTRMNTLVGLCHSSWNIGSGSKPLIMQAGSRLFIQDLMEVCVFCEVYSLRWLRLNIYTHIDCCCD